MMVMDNPLIETKELVTLMRGVEMYRVIDRETGMVVYVTCRAGNVSVTSQPLIKQD